MPRKPSRLDAAPAAAPSAQVFDFDKSGQVFKDSGAFFAFVAAYPDKSHAQMYLYRVKPIIKKAKPSYIDVFVGTDPITEALVSERWGPGTYHAMFNDQSRAGGSQVARCTFDIVAPDREPVLDWRDLDMDASDNKRLIERWRALGRIPETAQEGQTNMPDSSAVAALAGVVERVVEQRTAPAAAPVPHDPVDQMSRMVQALAPLLNGAPRDKSDSRLMDLLLRKFEAQESAANPDPLAHYERVADLLSKLGAGGARVERAGFDWEGMVKAIGAMLPMLLPVFAALRSPAPAPQAQYPMVPAGSVPVVPTYQAPGLAPMEEEDPMIKGLLGMFGAGVDGRMLQDLMNRAVAAYQRGVPGWNFASAIESLDENGAQVNVLRAIAAEKPEGIMGLMKMFPKYASIVDADPSRLQEWLSEFCKYFNEDGEPGEPEPEREG